MEARKFGDLALRMPSHPIGDQQEMVRILGEQDFLNVLVAKDGAVDQQAVFVGDRARPRPEKGAAQIRAWPVLAVGELSDTRMTCGRATSTKSTVTSQAMAQRGATRVVAPARQVPPPACAAAGADAGPSAAMAAIRAWGATGGMCAPCAGS